MIDTIRLLWLPIVVVSALLIACIWWLFSTTTGDTNDTGLIEFVEQSGYSIQHMAGGWWAVTDGAQKLVGQPAQTLREAIMSAVDVEVS
jgi:hypothetical protein